MSDVLKVILQRSAREFEEDPASDLECARFLLNMDRRNLAKITKRLEKPVYLRGPRAGRPMDLLDVAKLEAWSERLRRAIGENRAREAWGEGRLVAEVN